MAKVIVKLYGTLRKKIDHYDSVRGIEVEIRDGASIADLVAHLGIHESKIGFVLANGCIVKAGNTVENDAEVKIFQPIAGG
ncbi:MoaD/ThiS family protein [Desulfococcaceae bacterium HSG7]|nr:MoaD/ThiS family protein [Desulfococcaceae bacterium HSG7]